MQTISFQNLSANEKQAWIKTLKGREISVRVSEFGLTHTYAGRCFGLMKLQNDCVGVGGDLVIIDCITHIRHEPLLAGIVQDEPLEYENATD